MKRDLFKSFLILILFTFGVFAQIKDNRPRFAQNGFAKNCNVFLEGKLLNVPQPVYPVEAKNAGVSGKVDVVVDINEKGEVTGVKSVRGDELLKKSATDGALKARFSVTICDGLPSKTVGVITFNYTKTPVGKEYFAALKILEFTDVSRRDQFYESLLDLTENYHLAFGYEDKGFHGELAITRGDFAQFLYKTLIYLDLRGEQSGKNPRQLAVYQSYNPYHLKQIELNPNSPFLDAYLMLSRKYDIVLTDQFGNFAGNAPLKKSEIIAIWRSIFGDDSLPVNFIAITNDERPMTRGDFAVYLDESLQVLTYKLLPGN